MNFIRRGSIISLLNLRFSHFRCMSIAHQKIKNSYFSQPGSTLLLSSTLGQVLDESADKCGDRAAIISDFQGISKTYSQLRHETERLASGFISLGLKKGDRIALCSPNCYEWPLTQYAAAKAGLILVNINPASQPKEIEYCLKKGDCKTLVIWDQLKNQNFYQILCEVIPNLPTSNASKIQHKNLPYLENIIMISEDKKEPISDLQQKIKNSYYFKNGDLLLSCSTLGQVLDHSADQAGDNTAIVSDFQGISKNYSQFRHEAEKLTSGLISQGLRKGDRIAIYSPNCYEWSLTQFAAAKAGLILVNINPASQAKELEYFLKKVDSKAIVSWDVLKTQNFYKILCEIIPELPNCKYGKLQSKSLPSLENVIMISEQKHDGVLNFKDLADSHNKESDEKLSAIEKKIQFDDPVNIIFTSGTTGAPKGATLSHHNVVNNSLVLGRRLGFNLLKPVVCCHIPLFHSFGCVHGSIASVFFKGTCVFPSLGYDSISSLKAIEKYKCTVVYGAPTLFVDLIKNYKTQNFNIGSLKQACLGGAPANETLVNDIQQVLKIPQVHVGYGITETSPAVALNGINEKFENVVKGNLEPVEYVEVKIIDDKNHVVPVNTDGELCVRGHNVFIGYWNDEEQTSKVLDKTRWYHTGDICVMNEQGLVKIVGRKSDLIIRGGVNIYPLEIENFLNTHPSVLEVHACGVPDERLGEEVCVWISVKKDMILTEEEIRNFCKGQISHYKVPQYIMFVEDFPKTQSGKIQKFEMSKISIEKFKL